MSLTKLDNMLLDMPEEIFKEPAKPKESVEDVIDGLAFSPSQSNDVNAFKKPWFYDEDISNDLAKRLLGEKYLNNRKYKMSTFYDSIVIQQIDDTTPGGPFIEEFTLEEHSDEVISYEEVLRSTPHRECLPSLTDNYDIYGERPKHAVWIVVLISILILLGLFGFGLIYLVMNFAK